MQIGTLLIRADSGPQIGSGHVMRCLAIGQTWIARGGRVLLASAMEEQSLIQRVQSEGIKHAPIECEIGAASDAESTVSYAENENADLVILDGYNFDTDYQELVFNGNHTTLLLDDFIQSERFKVSAILNQNLHARSSEYESRAPGILLLMGTSYTLLRREYWPFRGRSCVHSGTVQRIIITLGGADYDNVTGTVISGLAPILQPKHTVIVAVGALNPHVERLQKQISQIGDHIQLRVNVSDMPSLLDGADLAICGGGATCWELAFWGIPFLPIILAENQRPIAESVDRAGAAINLGWHHQLQPNDVSETVTYLYNNPDRLRAMSLKGCQLVDGWGVERVIDALQTIN